MHVYAVDLGTTNLKVVLVDEELRPLAVARSAMRYHRDGDRVEFDAEGLLDDVLALIGRCAAGAGVGSGEPSVIAVTGQAESFVLLDDADRPLAPAISWMDERSAEQAREIAEAFDPVAAFRVTGEPEPVPTWPATKLRWLARHRPALLEATRRVLMIKDYVLLRLTGEAVGEATTRGFSYLFDVGRGEYWAEMAEFCGIAVETLAPIVPAGTRVGPVRAELLDRLPPAASWEANAGALDHFCGMVGSGSYRPGLVSASAGTVLALSMLAEHWRFDPAMMVSFHAGLRAGETVLFSCADSGGVSLSWFVDGIAGGLDYADLERALEGRDLATAPIFLPYLTGVNPPDFDADARGAFVGLQLRHDRVDLALAVMEGVAHLLRRNLDDLAAHGHPATEIVSAGGGSASDRWNRVKADACGIPVRTPEEPEATCRGAAVLALVATGRLDSIDDPRVRALPESIARPSGSPGRDRRYAAFETALHRLAGR